MKRHLALAALLSLLLASGAVAGEWQVALQLHDAYSISNADGGGTDDIYAKMYLDHGAESAHCNFKRFHVDGVRDIHPEWTCTATVTGTDPVVVMRLELWEHDGTLFTGSDDHFDIHPYSDQRDVVMAFRPASQTLDIDGVSSCPEGRISRQGLNGADRARVNFSVTAALVGAMDGDSDGDGLPDSWELCGLPGVNLPAMGADPKRKDLFVEIDWMMNDDGVGGDDHSHEPWLPSLVNAWHELRTAPVTNPEGNPSGIRLHVDVGTLYDGYGIDLDGNPGNEIDIGDCTPGEDLDLDGNGQCESIDLDGDGIGDIGDLAGAGKGTRIPPGAQEDPVLVGCIGGEVEALQDQFFSAERRGVFRHAIFAHQHGSASDGSSGVACSQDSLVVTLGTWTLGRNLAGVLLASPSGLPGRGTVANQTGTFLHELGHTMGLGHGGLDDVNYKPNYLSIMNYYFQNGIQFDLDGDLLADRMPGIDRDRDLRNDIRSFSYSSDRGRIPLDESNLDEPSGARDPGVVGYRRWAITNYGPCPLANDGGCTLAAPGSSTRPCTTYCSMLVTGGGSCRGGFCIGTALAYDPIDWDRDGAATDTGVNKLASTPPPLVIPTDLNFNAIVNDGSSGSQPMLLGTDDYAILQGGGLSPRTTGAVLGPGIDSAEASQMRHSKLGLAPVTSESALVGKCATSVDRIDFEGKPVGTVLSNEYDPLAIFPNSPSAQPTLEGPAERNGAPTESPFRSVVNAASFPSGTQAPPLVVDLPEPRRMVGLYMGRIELGLGASNALLRAYDQQGFLMGEVRAPILGSLTTLKGITDFVGAGATYPDRLISRIELSYEGAAFDEAPHMDDLVLCSAKTETTTPVTEPPPPVFGDLDVTIAVHALRITGEPVDDEGEPHVAYVEAPIPATVSVDATDMATDFDLTRPEGSVVLLKAIDQVGDALFVRWEIQFDRSGAMTLLEEGQREISPTLLHDATFTAIYVRDEDGDGYPDLGIADTSDNCPGLPNDQTDTDQDGLGNECDADDDGDGLLDAVESDTGIYVSPSDTGTDPLLFDSDGDGFGDGAEVQAGTDPNDPLSHPAPAIPSLGPEAGAILALLLLSAIWLIPRVRRAGGWL